MRPPEVIEVDAFLAPGERQRVLKRLARHTPAVVLLEDIGGRSLLRNADGEQELNKAKTGTG